MKRTYTEPLVHITALYPMEQIAFSTPEIEITDPEELENSEESGEIQE